MSALKRIVEDMDSDAFVISLDATEIIGYGFDKEEKEEHEGLKRRDKRNKMDKKDEKELSNVAHKECENINDDRQ